MYTENYAFFINKYNIARKKNNTNSERHIEREKEKWVEKESIALCGEREKTLFNELTIFSSSLLTLQWRAKRGLRPAPPVVFRGEGFRREF